MFCREELLGFIKKAIGGNILCFDSNAKEGELTDKVFMIMDVIMKRSLKDDLQFLFLVDKLPLEENKFDWDQYYDVGVFSSEEFDFTEAFTGLGGSLATGDVKLILGVGKNGKVILGSY